MDFNAGVINEKHGTGVTIYLLSTCKNCGALREFSMAVEKITGHGKVVLLKHLMDMIMMFVFQKQISPSLVDLKK